LMRISATDRSLPLGTRNFSSGSRGISTFGNFPSQPGAAFAGQADVRCCLTVGFFDTVPAGLLANPKCSRSGFLDAITNQVDLPFHPRSPCPIEGVARAIVWRQHTDCAGGSNVKFAANEMHRASPRLHVDGNSPMRLEAPRQPN
jgi:hypothetical protein